MPRPLVLLFALAGCGSEPPDEPSQPPPARELVRLSLIADRARIVPGVDLELAARLEIADGWHLYWLNPGEAGLPTKASFTAPAGFAVGEVAYPGPVSFRSPGGIVTYGYAKETALFARVRAPAEAAGPATFSVSANWLACRENCVRGKGTATLVLPLASPAGAQTAAPPGALEAHRALLPRPWGELGAEPAWTYADGEMRMELTLTGASSLELFPLEDGGVRVLGQTVRHEDGRAVIQTRFSTDQPAKPSLRGALRVDRAGRITYYAVDIPWPC